MSFSLELPIHQESEYSAASQEAPHPELYSCYDNEGSEVEALEALATIVRVTKPRFILETGTYHGCSAAYICDALKRNGSFGRMVSIEIYEDAIRIAKDLLRPLGFLGSGPGQCEIIHGKSLDYVPTEKIDLLFSDSCFEARIPEVNKFRPHLAPRAWVAIHDYPKHRGSIGDISVLNWLERVELPTPRGLTFGRLA